jgi:hypothetical protein
VDWNNPESVRKIPQYNAAEKQIASMRFNAKNNFFYGNVVLCVTNGIRQYREEVLTHEWVKNNISKEFQQVLRARGSSTGFLFIPAGNANTDKPYPYQYNESYPTIKFQQGERNTCATSSFASCLHHLGFESTAKWVEDFGKNFVEDSSQDQHRIMQQMIHHVQLCNPEFTAKWDVRKIKVSEFKIWNDDNIMIPKLLHILGSDGGVGHALTIYNGLIFDSNLEYAVDLTVLNLEFCIGAVYEGIVFGYKFLPKEKQLTKSKKARTKKLDRKRMQCMNNNEEDKNNCGKKRKRTGGRSKAARKRRQVNKETCLET